MFDVATRQCHGPRGGPGTRDDNVVDTGIKMGFLARSTRSEKSVRAMWVKIMLQKRMLNPLSQLIDCKGSHQD